MSLITSLRSSAYNSVAPKVRNIAHHNFNKTEFKGSNNGQKTEKQKNNFPWKKVLLGVAITAVAVEGILRFDPIKRRNSKMYTEIFTNPDRNKRDFMMISSRAEAIISEVANGNESARKMFDTLDCDADGILEYMLAENKVQRAKRNFIEGRFDDYRKKRTTVEQEQEKFFRHIAALKQKSIDLYKKHLEPLIKF